MFLKTKRSSSEFLPSWSVSCGVKKKKAPMSRGTNSTHTQKESQRGTTTLETGTGAAGTGAGSTGGSGVRAAVV